MVSNVILTEDQLRDVVEEIGRHDAFVFDVEAQGPHRGVPHLNTLSWIALATDGLSVAIPFGHPIGSNVIGTRIEPKLCSDGKVRNYKKPIWDEPPPQLKPATVFEMLHPLFFREDIVKVAQGASYDFASVPKYWDGQVPLPPWDDTIILDWLLNENLYSYRLKDRIKQVYGVIYDTDNTGKMIEAQSFDKAAHYAYMDARYEWLFYKSRRPQIDAEGLTQVHELELDILGIMVGMRLTGARVDVPKLESLRDDLAVRVKEIEHEVYAEAGRRFNLNSPQQKQQLLYTSKKEGGQGLKPWKLTKGGKTKNKNGEKLTIKDYATDAEALESFKGNPLASKILEYQDVNKLYSTYLLGWLGDGENKECQIYDGRIHADFVQYGTVTGRFSCRAPNLQNIPRSETTDGKILRECWIADEGGKLVVADYGAVELVMLAHYIGRGALYEGFLKGIDPHTMTAAMVLGKRACLCEDHPDDITPYERQHFGKSLNFAVVYGAGIEKVAAMMNCSQREAKRIWQKHRRLFPEIYAYRDAVIEKARSRKSPYVRTLLGRKRRLPMLRSNDDDLRRYTERQAFNSLIQGSAADLMKLAMVRADRLLAENVPDAYLALTVHDELVTATPEEFSKEVADIISEAMTGDEIQALIRVPLTADVHIADSWGEAK